MNLAKCKKNIFKWINTLNLTNFDWDKNIVEENNNLIIKLYSHTNAYLLSCQIENNFPYCIVYTQKNNESSQSILTHGPLNKKFILSTFQYIAINELIEINNANYDPQFWKAINELHQKIIQLTVLLNNRNSEFKKHQFLLIRLSQKLAKIIKKHTTPQLRQFCIDEIIPDTLLEIYAALLTFNTFQKVFYHAIDEPKDELELFVNECLLFIEKLLK